MKNPKVIAAGMVAAAVVLTGAGLAAGISWTSYEHTAVVASSAAPLTYTAAAPTSTAPTSLAPTTTAAAPTPGSLKWSGNGVFSVGSKPSGGAKASIPPGRYTVELSAGATNGYWMRCASLPCGMFNPEVTPLAIGNSEGPGWSTVVDILPTDGAVYLSNVTFTQVPGSQR